MEIKLQKLKINNFKGIKNLEIDFKQTTNIYGENATGKTTIFDAFNWLLFDKDSSNKKDFNIKTLAKDGEALHGLEHSVEGDLTIDGKILNLRKVFTEKWVKQRGSAEKIFSGHETNYWINEVPVKKNEYQSKINSLIDEDKFKLISNPLHFNLNLDWKKRREVIMEIVGDFSDQDIIDSNEKIKRLSVLLQDKTLDEFKAMIAGQKKRFNDELKSIPIRIDELSRGIPTLDADVDYKALEQEKSDLQIIVGNLEKDLTDQRKIAMDLMNSFKKKQSIIAGKRNELNKLETDIVRKLYKAIDDLRYKKMDFENQIKGLESRIKSNEESIVFNETLIKKKEKELAELRVEFNEITKAGFEIPDKNDFVCPTCKQQLPDDNIDKQIEILEINFNADKKSRLENINFKGKSGKKYIDSLKKSNEVYETENESNQIKLNELVVNLEIITNQIEQEKTKSCQVDYKSDENYIALEAEIKTLEEELENNETSEIDASDLINKKQNCNNRISEINKILNNKQVIADTQKRIEQLEESQRDIANKVMDLEGQEYLAEQFIRTKVDMLESRINEKFSQVNFKMFNEQINGALVECCDTLIKGVPFQDANNAAKINAGMDIINTLTTHYNITAPIFVDNREAVNKLINTDSQVINLIVSQDKVLRVEV
ncbi:DNA repair exonuclease SbcCD ATPase subunit [Sedimentibacter acidaminivorans]|uniref:Nuclease SbcCD subunit C n=1 Tax=Sedimentibacter acidaminivorans TaxID=913099 RepID=A0ABS4GAC1_9FIRM|nr:AAA family ATPase [Sedimentibacter acidaminivorans]MBP1924621.1 DNA repair exonuclease SbcCD ATPase subunit [Sedimentibacter acidaminivorans]